MALKTIRFTKEEMNSRVARFDQLQGFDGGLPTAVATRRGYSA